MRLYNRTNKRQLKEQALADATPRTTLSFYRYLPISNPENFRDQLFLLLASLGVFGRIYVANEGINGQISIPSHQLDALRNTLNGVAGLEHLRLNIAIDQHTKAFYLLKIKIRSKIVADGLDDKDFDLSDPGTHLDAKGFNELTDQGDTLVVDMRNHYESEVGHFGGALCPSASTFREALDEVGQLLSGAEDRNIVMYCTGGIRCEKATAYFKSKGFKRLFQLDGGIIEYARQAQAMDLPNKFKGKNFVFDDRLGERISPDIIAKCHQCGAPADTHVNCANDACHLLFIQCDACASKYNQCCSEDCRDFVKLPIEVQRAKRKHMVFTGTQFGKGRYRAHRPETIELTIRSQSAPELSTS